MALAGVIARFKPKGQTMIVEQAKKQKRDLENAIVRLLHEFDQATGVVVSRIEVKRVDVSSRRKLDDFLYQVRIVVEL